MDYNVFVILFLVSNLFNPTVPVDPTGCTYFASELRYECTMRSWVLPLTLTDFDNIPQVLHLIEVNGELPSTTPTATFSGFSAINNATFDVNVVPALVVRCVSGGSLIMSAGTFSGMSYIQDIRFLDCNLLNVPDAIFSDIGDVHFLYIIYIVNLLRKYHVLTAEVTPNRTATIPHLRHI